MRNHGIICILLCLTLVISLFSLRVAATEALAAVDPSVSDGCHSADAAVPLLGSGQMVTNAQSVFMYEVNSDTLLYAWNPDQPAEPASLVKIMTALIAAETGNLTDVVTVRQDVLNTVAEDAVSSELLDNEVLTLEDLLYCMMIDSGNDAAAVIADHVAGSQTAFVELMNSRAQELGCTGTNFTNVHGIYDEQQVTTARDMGKILVAAAENDAFSEIFGTVYYNVAATNKSEERKLTTGNALMSTDEYFDERVTGGRTGVASDGSRSLATTAEYNGMKIVSILIGLTPANNSQVQNIQSLGGFTETKTLLDTGFTGYYSAQILYEGQVLAMRNVLNGNGKVSLGCASAASTVLPEGVTVDHLSFRYVNSTGEFTVPIQKGDILCGVEIWYGSLCVAYANLYALNSVAQAETMVISREYTAMPWWQIVLIVLLVIAIAVVAFLAVRKRNMIRKMIKMWQRKRRWKNRRGGR